MVRDEPRFEFLLGNCDDVGKGDVLYKSPDRCWPSILLIVVDEHDRQVGANFGCNRPGEELPESSSIGQIASSVPSNLDGS